MKGGRRTAKGRIINIDDVIAASPHTTAVGNMKVNAQGDELGKGGEVTKTREQRTRAYYKDHPQASNQKVSLKGDMNSAFEYGHNDFGMEPDTASTGKENVRTAYQDQQAEEPEEFDDVEMPPTDPEKFEVEPDGYEEVELENGDIVMKPYWNNPDET